MTPAPEGAKPVAEVTAQPDGGASVTVTQTEAAGLKALAAVHLPFLTRAEAWFGRDLAPELAEASAFLRSLAANPAEGSTLTVTAPQAQTLRGLLVSHIPDFSQVLAVVESPVVRELLTFAKALL
jgi:hypothetical protein